MNDAENARRGYARRKAQGDADWASLVDRAAALQKANESAEWAQLVDITWGTQHRMAEMGERLAASEAARDELQGKLTASLTVTEPLTYRRGGQHSFFYDVVRARRSIGGAGARLAAHEREMDVELPKRAQRRARAAQAAYEAAFYSTPADRRAMDEMLAAGRSPFESRAVSRTPGQSGYLDPPIYLVDQYVPFAREASPFASAWHPMDLPPATSEINVPRLTLGAAVGSAGDLQPAASRDIYDSLVSATVRTIAGNADASIQWLEQGSGSAGFGVDEMIFADLTADIATNTDGQALLGAGGTSAQILGVWPSGAIAAANGILVADTSTTSSQTWTVASAGSSLHVYAAQLVSLSRRLRARSDGWAWYWHPWVWSLYASQVDSQGRPLVNCQCGDLPDGVLGYYQNIPVYGDSNIPTTFGGSALAPYMGTITNGQYAAYPGTGTGASYTPMLLARAQDLFLFAGDIRLQLLTEVLSGSGQVRFQALQYLAGMPNRYVAAAATGSNVSAGGDVAHGTLTWQETESLLILSGSGF